MKYSFILIVLLGLILSSAQSTRGNDLFQVVSSHPHDLEEIQDHIETVYQNGRLWVVQVKPDAPANVLEHLRPLSGREKSYHYEGRPEVASKKSSLSKFETTTNIDLIVSQVNPQAIEKDVIELASYQTRRAGTVENQQATQKVGKRFQDLGFKVQEICYDAKACSLIAEKKGSSSKEEVLMVIGHIDSVGKSFAGADDNASGVAVMLEMAKNLKNYSNKKTIRFFVSNGEELGLLGATQYAQLLEKENKLSQISLTINMDMVGYNSNGIVELETDAKFEPLAKWFADLAAQYTTLKTKITIGAWGSDHVPFLRRNVPTILTIEDWDTKTPCYHQACDKPDTLNYEYAGEIAKLNLSAILTRDNN